MSRSRGDRYNLALFLLIGGMLAVTGAVVVLIFRPQLAGVVAMAGAATPAPSIPAVDHSPRIPEASQPETHNVHESPGAHHAASAGDPAIATGRPTGGHERTLRDVARAHAAVAQWDAAIRAYDRLLAGGTADRELVLERARVLAWSGAGREAVQALTRSGAMYDPAVRLEAARFLVWAGDPVAADSLVRSVSDAALRAVADSMRTAIRQSAEPDVALASRWLADRDGPLERLLLARALVRAERPAEALIHYRRLGAVPAAGDSILLELADAAVAADSIERAATAVASYLQRHPQDRDARLRLARVRSWTGEFAAARREYLVLLEGQDDASLRFELARVDAWSGEFDLAENALHRLAAERPVGVEAAAVFHLRGDVQRWRGDVGGARATYALAVELDPDREGLAESIAALPPIPVDSGAAAPVARPADRWEFAVDAFGDTEQFRWLSTDASRTWDAAAVTVRLGVRQDLLNGRAPDGSTVDSGYGLELGGAVPVGRQTRISGSAGLRGYGSGVTFGTWSAGLARTLSGGGIASTEYRRQPAVRRVATSAALEAGVVSDVVSATLSTPLAGTHLWSQAEVERLGSGDDGTGRLAGSVSLSRALGGGWSAIAAAGAVTTDGPSPVLDGWGAHFWAPVWYIAPSVGAAWESALADRVTVRVRMLPGHAWIRERDDSARRFAASSSYTLATGLDAAYRGDVWNFEVGGEWGGGIESGYHASAIRARIIRNRTRR